MRLRRTMQSAEFIDARSSLIPAGYRTTRILVTRRTRRFRHYDDAIPTETCIRDRRSRQLWTGRQCVFLDNNIALYRADPADPSCRKHYTTVVGTTDTVISANGCTVVFFTLPLKRLYDCKVCEIMSGC